jgi:transcriptional regulator with XRE-family HTH domain
LTKKTFCFIFVTKERGISTMGNVNSVSTNIRLFRENGGFKQEDIAKYLGVQREVISYYENGSRKVPLNNLEKLAELFGVSLLDLLEENTDLTKSKAMIAFRANELKPEDLENIAKFRRIVSNYLKMINILKNNE